MDTITVASAGATRELGELESLKYSEERFRAVAQMASDAIVCTDSCGKVVFWNQAAQDILGYPAEEIMAKPVSIFISPRDWERFQGKMVEQAATGQLGVGSRDLAITCRRKDGTEFPAEVSYSIFRMEEGVYYTGILRDVTERTRVEATRTRLIAILEATPDYVATADATGRILFLNKAGYRLLGIPESEENSPLWIHQAHPEWATALIMEEAIPAAVRDGIWRGENALLSRDGREIPVSQVILAHKGADGNVEFLSTIARDISDRKQHEQQLAYLASHDSLTGLLNRRFLEEALKREVARAQRRTPGALLFTDADDFKRINDTLGHDAGDQALVRLARLLEGQLRANDLIARVGGDEFAVLLQDTSLHDARTVAERMREAVVQHGFELGGLRFTLSISIGMVAIDGQENPVTLFAQADTAMYQSKEQGGNRVVLFRREEEPSGQSAGN